MKRAAAIVMAAIMGIGMAGIRATSTTAAQNPQSITAYKKFLKHDELQIILRHLNQTKFVHK